METRIATNIETGLFYSIIKYLASTDWVVSVEYSNKLFDKGIDFDFYQLDKNGRSVSFAWTNWFEGELKTEAETIESIEKQFGITFTFGKPEYLSNDNLTEEMKELLDFKK